MEYNVDRMQVLSGLKSRDNVLSESTQDMVLEEKIRRIIREEIQAYLHERKAKVANHGFANGNVSAVMGFAGPGFGPRNQTNRTVSRGPGRTFGFGGPGFM